MPKLPEDKGAYTGTGDLFSSLLLGWSIKADTFQIACEKAVATLQAVLTRTYLSLLFSYRCIIFIRLLYFDSANIQRKNTGKRK